MFERFTQNARETVVAAHEHARRLGQQQVGTEHLLLALSARPGALADVASPQAIETELGRGDRLALAQLGIDQDEITAATEARFGPEALKNPPVEGRPHFNTGAKTVLELALREAVRLKHGAIGADHLTLGVLREGHGLGYRVLVDLGVDVVALRTSIEAGHAA